MILNHYSSKNEQRKITRFLKRMEKKINTYKTTRKLNTKSRSSQSTHVTAGEILFILLLNVL